MLLIIQQQYEYNDNPSMSDICRHFCMAKIIKKKKNKTKWSIKHEHEQADFNNLKTVRKLKTFGGRSLKPAKA